MQRRIFIAGIGLDSDVPLHALDEAPIAPPDVPTVRLRRAAPRPPREVGEWLFERQVRGETRPGASVARSDAGYLVRIHGAADFEISHDGHDVLATPFSPMEDADLEHLVLDHILPLVLQLHGVTCLHASAVSLGERGVIAFVGASGAGKSTLAAALASPTRPLVSDDSLALAPSGDKPSIFASYGSVRLRADSAAAVSSGDHRAVSPRVPWKVRVHLPALHGERTLRKIYVLQRHEAETIEIEELRGRQAITEILPHLQRLDPFDVERLRAEAHTLLDLVERVRIARLHYPSNLEWLDRVCRRIVDDVS